MAYRDEDIDLENLGEYVKEYLASGGTITECEKYARSEDIEYTVGWGKKRKKSVDRNEK